MLDRGDVDESLPNCPWKQEDAVMCDQHDIEMSAEEDEEGFTIYLCRICESLTFRPFYKRRSK
tara:strand:- start:45 stop:233 length:189 start_codon:yes stop_codon:yes gene_type:complete